MAQTRMNIPQLLDSRVLQHPDKAFVIFEDQVISYADFDTTVNQVASGFLRLGISAGDRVCVMLSNCPEFLYAWFGLMKIGAILVPINSAFRSRSRTRRLRIIFRGSCWIPGAWLCRWCPTRLLSLSPPSSSSFSMALKTSDDFRTTLEHKTPGIQ